MPTLASGLRISSQLGPVETIPQTHRGPHGLSMTRSVKRAIVGMSGDPFNIRLMFVYRRARRVRWRLPPPPPSRVGARTPGSLRGSPPFSRCMWGDFGGRGRSAGETRDDRGEVAAGLQEIVSRAGFRGPGWALPGHLPSCERRTSNWAAGTVQFCRPIPARGWAPVRIGIPVVPPDHCLIAVSWKPPAAQILASRSADE